MTSNSKFRFVLELALKHSLDHLENLDHSSVAASVTLNELRRKLAHQLNDDGIDSFKVINELVEDTTGGLLGSAGGRFFGWAIGGSVPASLAADWLTSAWDQNAALFTCAPAVTVIEEVCGGWLKEILGLPATASFAFVTGSQMAHVTCLAAARSALLLKKNWDVEHKGLNGAPPIRILSSSERHGSIERAVRLLGLGSHSVIDLPVDSEGRLLVGAIEKKLKQQPDSSTIVVLQAGDLNIGAYDSFSEIIPIAHLYNAWVHIDGAFGLWVAASPKYCHLFKDANLADSWVTDGHKWLNVPYDCGYAFIADSKSHRKAISHRASYLIHDEEARDQIDWNPEWSRRGRGVATYAAIRQLGKNGIADLIERTCGFAHTLVRRIAKLKGTELVWEPTINQGLIRFTDPAPGSNESDHDRFTDKVMEGIKKTGEAFFTGTTWKGKRCMRVSVINWQTNENDINRAVNAIEKVLAKFYL
jgi:glutamate/tyrosine decarboxylase-like PLP-dependent enzyme